MSAYHAGDALDRRAARDTYVRTSTSSRRTNNTTRHPIPTVRFDAEHPVSERIHRLHGHIEPPIFTRPSSRPSVQIHQSTPSSSSRPGSCSTISLPSGPRSHHSGGYYEDDSDDDSMRCGYVMVQHRHELPVRVTHGSSNSSRRDRRREEVIRVPAGRYPTELDMDDDEYDEEEYGQMYETRSSTTTRTYGSRVTVTQMDREMAHVGAWANNF